MSAIAAARPGPSWRLGRFETRGLVVAIAASLWILCHPYVGIQGDSSIYIGRVLADLDPGGLGRDLMFANDGQSRFSLFPLLARPVVQAFGASTAALLIAAAASACWFIALLSLARGLATRERVALAMVLVVAVLPPSYGQIGFFYFGEAAAVPRPFAEAAVIAALAAMLAGRTGRAALWLGLAVLFHPLMASAGLGVAAFLALRTLPRRLGSRRALALGGTLSFLVVGSWTLGLWAPAWLGAPLFERAFAVADPIWIAQLLERSPHLFPTHWAAGAFAPILIQTATLLFAIRRAETPARRVYGAVLITTALGLCTSAILADTFHLLLAIQVQTWRVTWLLAVVAGAALVSCAARLREEGPAGQVGLCLLVLGWLGQPDAATALGLAGVAGVLESDAFRVAIRPRHAILCAGASAILILIVALGPILAYVAYLASAAAPLSLMDPLRHNLHTVPLCIVVALWVQGSPKSRPVMLVLGAAVMASLGILVWDQRGADARYFETRQAIPGIAAIGPASEILWLEGRAEEWYAFGHPQYFSPQQAVSMVFSRPLALEWHRRAALLVALGLVKKSVFRPWAETDASPTAAITQTALDTLCRRDDAPGLVVVPLAQGTAPFAGMMSWALPQPHRLAERRGATVETLGLVPCGVHREARDTKS